MKWKNIPKYLFGEAGGSYYKCEAWPNDGILMWGYYLKKENKSNSDFIMETVRVFVVFER